MRMHSTITQVVESETVHSQIEFKSSQVYTETTDNHTEAYRMCPECAPEASTWEDGDWGFFRLV